MGLCISPKVNRKVSDQYTFNTFTTHQSKQIKPQRSIYDDNFNNNQIKLYPTNAKPTANKQKIKTETSQSQQTKYSPQKDYQNSETLKFYDIKNSGLPNIGNTCFLNSIIQFFFSAQKFIQEVMSFNDETSRIHLILAQIFKTLKKNASISEKQNALKKLIRYLRTIEDLDYQKSSQQDSLKFMTIILNHLAKKQPQIMNLILLQYLMKCSNQKCSKEYQKFKDYSYSVTEECCHQCQSNRQMILLNEPQYIMILGYDKDSQITIKKRDDTELQYKLISQIHYRGNGEFGHYIATRLVKIDKKFYQFNDSYVTEVSDSLSKIFKVKVSLYSLNKQSESKIENKNITPTKGLQRTQKRKDTSVIYQGVQVLDQEEFSHFNKSNSPNTKINGTFLKNNNKSSNQYFYNQQKPQSYFDNKTRLSSSPEKNKILQQITKINRNSNQFQPSQQQISNQSLNRENKLSLNGKNTLEAISNQIKTKYNKQNNKQSLKQVQNQQYFTIVKNYHGIVLFILDDRNRINISRVILDPNRLKQLSDTYTQVPFNYFDDKIKQNFISKTFKVFIQPSKEYDDFVGYKKWEEQFWLSSQEINNNYFFDIEKIYQVKVKTSQGKKQEKIIFSLQRIKRNRSDFRFYWLNRYKSQTDLIIKTLREKYKTEPIRVLQQNFSESNRKKLKQIIETRYSY